MSPLVDIRHVSVSFAGEGGAAVHALRDVSLEIAPGRIVGLVGESGSGKSTLALALIGLLSSNAARRDGSVAFDGLDLMTMPESGWQRLRGHRIAMIFQDPMTSLNPVFTIGLQMVDAQRASQPALSRRERRRRAVVMLERVGIADAVYRLDQYPHQFSGGMRQRIVIAMAMLAEPELLIADEPTTALDVTVEAQIVRLLRELQSETGCSVLFVSHSLGLVSGLCDDVVVLYAGCVVEVGSAASLFAMPRHPYTQALIACEVDPDAPPDQAFVTIPGTLPDLRTTPTGCVFAPRCPHRMPVCVEAPPMFEAAPGHRAACWLLAA